MDRKQWRTYYDCITFWARMGVQKEDNLIALASMDVLKIYKERAEVNPYYIDLGTRLLAEISSSKYDKDRGKDGFLGILGEL